MNVQVYSVGIVHASVCAPSDMPLDDVLDAVNLRAPTGLDHGWMPSLKETFSGGQPNPCQCDTDPDSRVHYLLEC